MSFSITNSERRLSANGRNAYISLVSTEETNKDNKNKKIDDSLYLTAKTNNRARSCSPALFTNSESTIEESAQTTADNQHKVNNIFEAPKSIPQNNQQILKSKLVNKITAVSSNLVTQDRENKNSKMQVGIDRYITVLKRGRSPNSSKVASVSKINKNETLTKSQNRFALLDDASQDPIILIKSPRPPPVYLREPNSNEIINLVKLITGENSFYVTSIKRGNIQETKIQVNTEDNYRKLVSEFEKRKKSFYTYQLKSCKGLQVVIKGIDCNVDTNEIKESLQNNGFKVKTVTNIRNRERIPQPLFRVELEPGDVKLKKNEVHPIYNLKYLLYRKITIEEPIRRSGPVQCQNCQEYGHTRSYCKLPAVCVVCGELHSTSKCNKPKNDSTQKKCSNCGGNHTANYRGCPVYDIVKRSKMTQKLHSSPQQSQNVSNINHPLTAHPSTSKISYANILKSNNIPLQYDQTAGNPISSGDKLSRLETTIETLVQSVNNFTNSLGNMMQEMLKMQSMLLQAVLNKP